MVKNCFILKEWFEQIGLYPIPNSLSTSSIFKGWIIFILFLVLNFINTIYFEFILWKISWFLSESTTNSISEILNLIYWKLSQYIVKKKKIKIVISGINLKDSAIQDQLLNSIVMSNHRSLFDYLLINYLKNLVEKATGEKITLNFFTWNSIWNLPVNKFYKSIVNNDENWVMNKIRLKTEINNLIVKNKYNWIVHFPEVNIFDDEIKIIQHQQADLNYLPKYNELLYPRFKNFTNFIESQQEDNATSIKNLLDLTILYYHPIKETFITPTILEILTVKQPILIIHVDFKLKSLIKLPTKPRKLEKWLEDDWNEKDKMIDAIKKQIKVTR